MTCRWRFWPNRIVSLKSEHRNQRTEPYSTMNRALLRNDVARVPSMFQPRRQKIRIWNPISFTNWSLKRRRTTMPTQCKALLRHSTQKMSTKLHRRLRSTIMLNLKKLPNWVGQTRALKRSTVVRQSFLSWVVRTWAWNRQRRTLPRRRSTRPASPSRASRLTISPPSTSSTKRRNRFELYQNTQKVKFIHNVIRNDPVVNEKCTFSNMFRSFPFWIRSYDYAIKLKSY